MLYLDTNKLKLHIDYILEEKRTAQKIFDSIQAIKRLSYSKYTVDNGLILKFQHLVKNSDDLVNYYSKMSSALDQTAYEAIKMISKTNQMLTSHLDTTNRLINQTIDCDVDDK